MNINTAKIESLVRQLLREIGEDPERERDSSRRRGAACTKYRTVGVALRALSRPGPRLVVR